MKIEKIQKHMSKRTVVVGGRDGCTTAVGVIAEIDLSDSAARISGYVPPDDHDFNWYGFDAVRKATDDERTAFFAWLRENGRDIADGFKRLGGAPRGWEDAPAQRAVFNAATPNDQRAQVVGKRVRILVAHTETNKGKVGQVTNVDNSHVPYLVSFSDGETGWAVEIEVIEDAPTAAPPAAPKRLTVGDAAIAVYDDGRAVMGKITRDDHDLRPYSIDGKNGFFRANRTHPITLDGFRAAAAQQRAEGVTFEEGDYAALIGDDGEVRAGTISGRAGGLVCLHFAFATYAALKGSEDWTDRVVVLTKRPKI